MLRRLIAKVTANYAVVGFAFSVVILVVIGVETYRVTREFITANERVAHTLEVNQTITEVFAAAQDLQAEARGYVITGDDRFLDPSGPTVAGINEELKKLGGLVAAQFKGEPELKQVPIVFMTAMVARRERDTGERNIAGHPLLAKPIRASELLDCVEKQLGQQVTAR